MTFSRIRSLVALVVTATVALVLAGAAPTASDQPAGQLFAFTYHDKTGTGVALGFLTSGEGPAPARTTIYVPAGYGLNLSRGRDPGSARRTWRIWTGAGSPAAGP
jgi:hypothetical protein